MAIPVNESGTLKELTNVYGNENGTIVAFDTVYANENGSIVVIHTNKVYPTGLTWSAVTGASYKDIGNGDGMTSISVSVNTNGSNAYYVKSGNFNVTAGTKITIEATSMSGGSNGGSMQVQIYDSNNSLVVDEEKSALFTYEYEFTTNGAYYIKLGGFSVSVSNAGTPNVSISYGFNTIGYSISFS